MLERIGYDCAMVFVNTTLETALERASKRRRKVKPDVIEDYYHRLQIFKNDIKGFFSFYVEIQNNDDDLTDEVILKAFKRISYFYSGAIDNPIGRERFDQMSINGWKYLNPNILTIDEIKQQVIKWYR